MLNALQAFLAPAAMARFTLLLNHVLAGEPAATTRLKPHAGRCIGLHLSRWPSLLPQPPATVFSITPAGLLEWCGAEAPPRRDLQVTLDAANPAGLALQWLSGQPPAMEIEGDSALAADVNWLAQHLRWDMADDLERLLGPAAAHQAVRIGRALASALRSAARAGAGLAAEARGAKDAWSPRAPAP